MKNEARLRLMKRAFGSRRALRALRFIRAQRVLHGGNAAASYRRKAMHHLTKMMCALRHIWQTSHHCDQRKQHHFECSEKHHIAARRCIIFNLQGSRLDLFTKVWYNILERSDIMAKNYLLIYSEQLAPDIYNGINDNCR